jgi:hypothetical protein
MAIVLPAVFPLRLFEEGLGVFRDLKNTSPTSLMRPLHGDEVYAGRVMLQSKKIEIVFMTPL